MPTRKLPSIILIFLALVPAAGQTSLDNPPPMRVPLADRQPLQRLQQLIAVENWALAAESLADLLDQRDDGLTTLDGGDAAGSLYLPRSSVCQLQLADLAQRAPLLIQQYRRLVDPQARRLLASGRPDSLQRVVRTMFFSSWGDDAAEQLGAVYLEQGWFDRARRTWASLDPRLAAFYVGGPAVRTPPDDPGDPRSAGQGTGQLVYPDTDLDPATVGAWLVSIRVAQARRDDARRELQWFRSEFAGARGTLAGRNGVLADLLEEMIQSMPAARESESWTTFAGDLARRAIAHGRVDPSGQPLWRATLSPNTGISDIFGASLARVGESVSAPLTTFPIVLGDALIWSEGSCIRALNLVDGAPVFPVGNPSDEDDASKGRLWCTQPAISVTALAKPQLGIERHTITAAGRRLFASVPEPAAGSADARGGTTQSLIGLDLDQQGKMLPGFPIVAGGSSSFLGSPVVVQGSLFVLRRDELVQSNSFRLVLESYPLPAAEVTAPLTPERQIEICQADYPSQDSVSVARNSLLSYGEGTLFVNTGAGLIVAVEAANLGIQWAASYPRRPWDSADPDHNPLHFCRDLSPCLVTEDLVVAAPMDSNQLIALDRFTGHVRWSQTAADIIHLLGVQGDYLLVSGDQLIWIWLPEGLRLCSFPPASLMAAGVSRPAVRGWGRGLLSDQVVYFPTSQHIHVFALEPDSTLAADGRTIREPVLLDVIELAPRGLTGGNLLSHRGMMILSTAEQIAVFSDSGLPPQAELQQAR